MEGVPLENKESNERGKNVQILLKFMRHGERDLDGRLTEYGREITRVRARESGIAPDEYDAVKAIGSEAGASSGLGARALETADIYAHEIASDEAFHTRVNSMLNYETLINASPFDSKEVYNSHIPKDFESLSDEEKKKAAKTAQTKTVDYLMSLETDDAVAYRKEIAGSFAAVVLHYCDIAKRLNAGSKVLIPAGTHGGTMEMILREAMVRKDQNNKEIIGFKTGQEIGGEFDPSEAYNVDIQTDDAGELKELRITFDDPKRAFLTDTYLDIDKVKELAGYYFSLHKEDPD